MPAKPLPIALYFWSTPNGYKISIAMEELGLPYMIHPVDITRGDQFEPNFLKISPNNKIPAIVDPDGPGGRPLSIFESGAILHYLATKTGRLAGHTPRERLLVDQWLFWQVASFGPMAGQCHHFRHYAPEKVPYGITRYTNEVTRLYGVLDRQLEGRQFIAGRYSLADIATFPWARLWARQGQEITKFPNVARWLERVSTRPAVIRGLAVSTDLPIRQIDPMRPAKAEQVAVGTPRRK